MLVIVRGHRPRDKAETRAVQLRLVRLGGRDGLDDVDLLGDVEEQVLGDTTDTTRAILASVLYDRVSVLGEKNLPSTTFQCRGHGGQPFFGADA